MFDFKAGRGKPIMPACIGIAISKMFKSAISEKTHVSWIAKSSYTGDVGDYNVNGSGWTTNSMQFSQNLR